MSKTVAILIPAYNPPAGFYSLLKDIASAIPGMQILVVDDGSVPALDVQIIKDMGALTIRHEANKGKGAALKTGFSHIADHLPGVKSIVTVDADGQHLPGDVGKVAAKALTTPTEFILGVRDFNHDIPLRSAIGNWVTRKIFALATGTSIRDTQTGLRAYPIDFAKTCCALGSDRYEFEMRTMFKAIESSIKMEQIDISTLYEEGNKTSHFRPLIDSMKVMAIFLRFLAVSISSFVVDIAAFYISFSMTGNIIASTYAARCLSATVNFTANKLFVFKASESKRTLREAVGYIALAFVIASMSALLVNAFAALIPPNVIMIKIGVDGFLFIVSFLVQKYMLFAGLRE